MVAFPLLKIENNCGNKFAGKKLQQAQPGYFNHKSCRVQPLNWSQLHPLKLHKQMYF
jgi:hypothetical protein